MSIQKMFSKRTSLFVLKATPLAVTSVFIYLYFSQGHGITLDTFLLYTPSNIYLAAFFLLFMYAVKSLSVVFPMIILYLSGGFLFPAASAIIINLFGSAICITIPFFIGRSTGAGFVSRQTGKNKKLLALMELQQENVWFFSFMARVLGFIPCDLASVYLGSLRLQYIPYLFGSLLGMLPGLITSTLAGGSMNNPGSPVFISSLGLTILISICSLLAYPHSNVPLFTKKPLL